MSRDTLLIVTTSYPMSADGSEAAGAFVSDFAETMARHMPVRVVGPGRHEGLEGQGSTLPVWRFAAGERPLSLLSPTKPWHWPSICLTLRSLRRQVFAAADDNRVAHTLALWALPSGWAARDLFRARGVPYSVWALGSDIWSLGRLPVVRRLLGGVCREAAGAYADGIKLASDAGLATKRPFVFLPSTRAMQASTIRRCRNIPPYDLLFLGRWHPNKGVDLLLDALNQMEKADWERIGRVRICGGGPLDSMVRLRAHQLAQKGHPVTVSGYLDKRMARKAIEECDYMIIPSRIESIPVVFSDAMKLGRPVIATPVGDLPYLVGAGGVGVLSREATAEALVDAIREAIAMSPSTFMAGVAKAAAQFDLEKIAIRISEELVWSKD